MSDHDWTVGNPPKGILERCPITNLPFFTMEREPDGDEMWATYGGPFESYTTPYQNDEGEWVWWHYDHDADDWEEGTELVPEGFLRRAGISHE